MFTVTLIILLTNCKHSFCTGFVDYTAHSVLGPDRFSAPRACDVPRCLNVSIFLDGSHMQCWVSAHFVNVWHTGPEEAPEKAETLTKVCADVQHCM